VPPSIIAKAKETLLPLARCRWRRAAARVGGT